MCNQTTLRIHVLKERITLENRTFKQKRNVERKCCTYLLILKLYKSKQGFVKEIEYFEFEYLHNVNKITFHC